MSDIDGDKDKQEDGADSDVEMVNKSPAESKSEDISATAKVNKTVATTGIRKPVVKKKLEAKRPTNGTESDLPASSSSSTSSSAAANSDSSSSSSSLKWVTWTTKSKHMRQSRAAKAKQSQQRQLHRLNLRVSLISLLIPGSAKLLLPRPPRDQLLPNRVYLRLLQNARA